MLPSWAALSSSFTFSSGCWCCSCGLLPSLLRLSHAQGRCFTCAPVVVFSWHSAELSGRRKGDVAGISNGRLILISVLPFFSEWVMPHSHMPRKRVCGRCYWRGVLMSFLTGFWMLNDGKCVQRQITTNKSFKKTIKNEQINEWKH